MKRYILTGAPGSGKTTLIKELEARKQAVVYESVTDIIVKEQKNGNMEPWIYPNFIDDIINLQKQRQRTNQSAVQFYDRSPICTYALALYLDFEPSPYLTDELDRVQKNKIYENCVFFVENLGFITNTDARKISFEDALRFEKIHLDTYKKFGYDCVLIPAAPVADRIQKILEII